jgi:replicative DNA helicase
MNVNQKNKEGRTRRQTADLIPMVYGKIPPQARDFEEAVLGAMMVEKDAFDIVASLLKPQHFYIDAHQKIYEAIRSLAQKSQPLDILTVSEELKAKGELELVGGSYYVTKLTNHVVNAAHLERHARIIIEKFVKRELIRIGGELINNAYEDGSDAFELMDEAEQLLEEASQAFDFGDMIGIDNVLVQAIQKIEEWRHLKTNITGTTSGIEELDRATRGWQNGDLIILAARPSVGKTAFVLNLVRNAAMNFQHAGKKGTIAVWSLEMKATMLVLRMLAAESREILYKIQTGRLEEHEMKKIYANGVQRLAGLNIKFDDKTGLNMQKLRSKARKLKRKNNLSLIVIDYLQLMTPDEKSGTREQEVSKISRNLKNLALELDVPIIALSQLSREVERRTGPQRKPQLSDLRESGSLEQDADVVMFLWAPTDDDIAADASLLNRRYLRIAKQRNGVLVQVDLDFKDEIQLFSEIDKMPAMQGNWKPVRDYTEPVKTGDKMNNEKDQDPF